MEKATKKLPDELELARDLLDKQVVDRDETKMGRVDGLVLELREGKPPRIDHLEMGSAVLARRIHPRFEHWVNALRRRIGVQKTGRYRVPWAAVQEIVPYHVKLDIKADETPAFAWEHWLRDHVIAHIPRGLKGKAS
jgi:sporulation protein YlmC with PRC-barrel domain